MTPELDLKQSSNIRDPYPLYRWLREHDPIHWSDSLRGWLISRDRDVRHVFQNPAIFASDRRGKIRDGAFSNRSAAADVWEAMGKQVAYRDPPDHTRLRRLLNKAFVTREVESMRPRIEELVNLLLDEVEAKGELDFIKDFAFPLPAHIISRMIGASTDDLDKLKMWSDDIGAYIGGSQEKSHNVDRAKRGLDCMGEYFGALMRRRKADPQDDLMSMLIAAEDEGDVFSDEEVVAQCITLLFGGHATTADLLGNGLFHLLRDPEQHQMLLDDLSLVPSAIEEFLRYESPVPIFAKVVSEAVELGGRSIERGQIVYVIMASANRDPSRFVNPDTLDIRREDNKHLAFGRGIHYCLGAPLARLEVDIAFSTLFRRFEKLTLVSDEPDWRRQIYLRGLKTLPIRFRPISARRGRSMTA